MKDRASRSADVRCVSKIAGRERWRVETMRGKPALAVHLERCLGQDARVQQVRCNHLTGSALVVYARNIPAWDIGGDILRALRAPVDATDVPPRAGSALRAILRQALPDRRQLRAPIALSAVSQAVRLLQMSTLIATVNAAQGRAPKLLQKVGIAGGGGVAVMGLLSATMTTVDLVLQRERKRAWSRLALRTQHNLRRLLVTHIQQQDMAFFDRYGSSELMQLVKNDSERIADFVRGVGDSVIEKALTVLVASIGLFAASPRLLLASFLPLPVLLYSFRTLRNTAVGNYAGLGQATAGFNRILDNSFSGVSVVKSFAGESLELQRITAADANVVKHTQQTATTTALQNQLAQSIYYFASSLMGGLAGSMLLKGGVTLTEFNRAMYWSPHLLGSLTGIQDITERYNAAADSARRISRVLAYRPSVADGRRRLNAKRVRGRVAFAAVSFAYAPKNQVLDGVSFELKPGETMGIVGPTGSGKSTLLRLLLRFYEVGSGHISIDGKDIRDLNLKDLRSAISLVAQDAYLFHGSVRDNIAYGRPGASDKTIIDALERAGASDLLARLPNGLYTEVGEQGRLLSGGERQRVAIARAIVKDAPILALDEATSHLDYETEFAVKQSLHQVAEQRSMLLIAHRLSTIRDADRILVLEKGAVREIGSHDDLLAKQGLYASLWALQNGSRNVAATA